MRQCSIAKRILSVLLACLLLSGAVITPLAAAPQERGQDTPERVQTSSEDTAQTQTEPEDAAEAEEPYDPEPEPQADELESVQPQAATISDDDLFFKHPKYLDNDYINEGYGKAEAACFAVLNSYSGSDEVIAACMQILQDGIISTAIMELSDRIGITQARNDRCLDIATKSFLKQYLSISTEIDLAGIVSDVDEKYKVVKDIYSYDTTVAKAKLVQDLTTKADLNGIHLSREGIQKVADNIYSNKMISSLLDAAGYVTSCAQIAITLMELYSIEVKYLDFLLQELKTAGLQNSDLYAGIASAKATITSDPANYIIRTYVSKELVKRVISDIQELFNAGSSLVGLVEAFAGLFAKYVYEGATADDLITCYQHMGFCAALDTCITKYRTKFRNGKGTQDDKERYLALFTARNAAYVAALQQCSTASRIMDRFRLGGDCLVWASNLQSSYTVDNYLSWCKSAIQNDISNETIDSSGETIITDALNEQTIKERLEKMASLPAYKPNVGKQWSGKFDGVGRSLGFAAMVFNTVFDKIMSPRVDSRYQYKLTNEANVRKLGQLEEGSVTAEALKTLFADARIGDVVISSGKDDNCHAMILLSVNESGLTVYDCNSLFHGTYDTANIIQQYEFSYDAMAKSFNSHGSYSDMAGIAVYRAIRKISPKNSGSNIYYEEFDDSINYVVEDGVLTAYNGACSKIEIPDGVTEIAAECFKNKTFIKYVYMPDTVKKIGESCFYGCSNLWYLDLSTALEAIEPYTFYGCRYLARVTIPDSVTWIGSYAFSKCTALLNVQFGDGLTTINESAFSYCSSLKEVYLPDGLTDFGDNEKPGWGYCQVFAHCTSLEKVYIPSSLTNVRNIGGTPSAEAGFFYECPNLKEIIWGEGITSIPCGLFRGCSGLTEVTIPDTVTTIEYAAFYSCTSLSSITIPDSVTEIGEYAFSKCTSLIAVSIPDTVTTYGGRLFNGCTALKTVSLSKNCLSIPAYMFSDCSSLESIELPDGVTKIETNTFNNCASLVSAVMPDSVQSIAQNAFYGCSKLESFTAGFDLTSIGKNAFYECKNLTDVKLNQNLTSIGEYAFYGCAALKTIVLPDRVNTIGSHAFQKCAALTDVTLPHDLIALAEYTFANCTALAEIVLPEGVTTIQSYAFYQDTKFTAITIPASVTSISNTNVISYPTKTTITGYAGSAAESYAATKKAKFVALETPTAPLTLADGSTTLTIGRGVTMRPAFNRDDIVSLSSDNYKVQVKNGMWLYGSSTGSAVITAKTASGESFTFTAYSKPVASVSVTPAQISGSLGEDLNTSGLCVTAAFSDGTSCPVTYYTLSGYSSRTEGERSVTVRYGDKSCTLTVNVSQAPASGTLGDTLRWRFDPLQNTLTFSGALPQNAQILVASYESTGKLLETQLIQNENAAVSLRPGAAKIKCFLVNDAFIPLCRAANIQEL